MHVREPSYVASLLMHVTMNCPCLRPYLSRLDKGKLTQKERQQLNSVGVVRKYVDKAGRRRVCGGPSPEDHPDLHKDVRKGCSSAAH